MALDWCTDNCFFRTCTIAIYNVSEKCSVNVSKTKRAKRRQFSHCDLVHLPKPFHWILGEISFSCTLFTFRTFRACQKVHSWAVFEYHCLMSTAEMTFSFMCDIVFNLQKVYALKELGKTMYKLLSRDYASIKSSSLSILEWKKNSTNSLPIQLIEPRICN